MWLKLSSRVNKDQVETAREYLENADTNIPIAAIEKQWLGEVAILKYELRKYIIHCILERKKTIISIDWYDSGWKTKTSRSLTSTEDQWHWEIIDRKSLRKPKPKQLQRPIMELYERFFPWAGKTRIFDRSWNNRAFVQKIMWYCNDELYEEFIDSLAQELFRLQEAWYDVHSFFFHIDKEIQTERLWERAESYETNFRYSESDKKALENHHVLEEQVGIVEQLYNNSGTPFTIIKWDDKDILPAEVIREFLREKDYRKKSTSVNFSRNTQLVAANINEIIQVNRGKIW